MVNGAPGFSWHVSTMGYRWIEQDSTDDQGEKEWYIVTPLVLASTPSLRSYDPTKNPALFRIFADTEDTKEGYLSFANNYGLLNREWRDMFAVDGRRVIGEPLYMWAEEHDDLRNAVEVYDMLQSGDIAGLEQRIKWDQKGRPFYTTCPEGLEAARESLMRAITPALRPDLPPPGPDDAVEGGPFALELILGEDLPVGEPIPAAFAFVRQTVNSHLDGAASARIVRSDSPTGATLAFVPSSLIGAIWLQFAETIAQNKTFRRCQECGAWFETSGQGTRTSRQFCSNACRVRAYRNRIAEAQRLHKEEGLSVEAIAEQLGSDTATVKGWIDRGK